MTLFLSLLLTILLFLQLQNLNASRYYSSPILSNPAINKKQLIHKGNKVKHHETQVRGKYVSVVDRRGGGGGGGARGGGGRGSKSGASGGLMAGAAAGSHHNHGHSDSSRCLHPYYHFWTSVIVMFNFILHN